MADYGAIEWRLIDNAMVLDPYARDGSQRALNRSRLSPGTPDPTHRVRAGSHDYTQ
jgi:hypothetical protein